MGNNLLTTSINWDSGIYYPPNPNDLTTTGYIDYPKVTIAANAINTVVNTNTINTVVDTNELKINIKKSRIKFNFNL